MELSLSVVRPIGACWIDERVGISGRGVRTPHNVRGLNTSPEQLTAHVSGQRRMLGFDPGFGIDSELPNRFEQAIGIGVRHSTRKIIFGSIALDTATTKISRELGELSVRCFERKKGVVVSACRFWPIARWNAGLSSSFFAAGCRVTLLLASSFASLPKGSGRRAEGHRERWHFAWFHDAIYNSMSKSNEERSADWAAEFISSCGATQDAVDRIRLHVLATRHDALPDDADSRMVIEIDLSILGADPGRYDEFERDVRREYRWVPRFIYAPKRAAILQSFSNRPRIYHYEPTFERFEKEARMNIARAIRTLSGGSSDS